MNARRLACIVLGVSLFAACARTSPAPEPASGAAQEARVYPEVPYVPTPPEVVAEMLKLAAVKKTDVVYDLGCGDGRIVITAVEKYGARGVGFDINPERIAEATENAKKAGVTGRVKFVEQNLHDANLSEASVVTLYLLPSVNLKLRPKLLKELKPGTRIVSHSFDMGDWTPEKTVEVGGRRIYYWTIPANPPAHLLQSQR
ncbi:MAG TPA: SAM-dependent methyltransferase [Solibacterales bacterium]|nr:SAM-dependent methyltransferase [Bryobacterales bacterium]